MKLSGNKSDLIQRIRDLMDRYRGENNVTGYSQVRRSLCEADSMYALTARVPDASAAILLLIFFLL